MKRMMMLMWVIVGLLSTGAPVVFSQTAPALLPEIKSVEIVECVFVTKYTGERYTVRVSEDELDEYRIAILTLRIEKESGKELKIAAADITLHYYHGENGRSEEVASCDGISVFSTTLNVDRTLKSSKCAPGWIKRTTGTRTTAASTVYVDVAFRQVEPDISNMWVCIAKPATARYSTTGWTP